MRLPRLTPVALALTLVLGACGDSTGPQVELTDVELETLFDQISDALDSANVPTFHIAGLGTPAEARRTLPVVPGVLFGASSMPPVTFSVSVGCANGGTVSVSGSGNDDDPSFDFTVTETFTNCQTEDFTIGGGFTVTGSGTESQTGRSVTVDVDGTLTVTTSDNRTGSCRLDYGVTASASSTSFSIELHGTICGRNVQDVIDDQTI